MRWFVNPLIAFSALLYAGAFIVPVWCHWLVFLWLLPLFGYVCWYKEQPLHLYMLQGFWWGTIFFTLHMYALIDMLAHYACLVDAVLISFLLIGYCATISACWFVCAALLTSGSSYRIRLVGWSCVTIIYIEFVQQLLFKIICLPRGYVFAYPLVPLACCPAWLAGLIFLPQAVLVACLCVIAACLTYGIIETEYRYQAVLTAVLFFSPFLVGWCLPSRNSDRSYQATCIWVQPPSYNKDMVNVTPLAVAQAINEQLYRAVHLNRQAVCILFPESTFPFPLDLCDDVRDLWFENALFNLPEVTIIMGGHHSYDSAGRERKNTLFCLKQCRIMQTYDKNTYLPFAEYLPWPWKNSRFFSEFLLKNKKVFHQIDSQAIMLDIGSGIRMSPYICSDLFFNYPRKDDVAPTIVWLVNDSWFCHYFRMLMFLHAQLQAHAYKRTIVYIAHTVGSCIEPYTKPYYLTAAMIPKNLN